MARFRMVAPRYWMVARKQGWTDDMMLLGAWLQTCEDRSLEGLFFLPVENIAGGLGWAVDRAEQVLAELERVEWCRRDSSRLFIWIPSAFDLTGPKGEKQIAGALSALEDIPGTSELMPLLYARACERSPAFATALAERWPVLTSGIQPPPDTPSEGYPDRGDVPHRDITTNTNTNTNTPRAARGALTPTFDRKPIPPARLELAEQLLADFNARFDVDVRGWTSDDKLTEDLRVIVGALTADDRIDRAVGGRMIDTVHAGDRYWSGRPHPGLVFGGKVRERNAEAAIASPAGGSRSGAATYRRKSIELAAKALREERLDDAGYQAAVERAERTYRLTTGAAA